MPAFVLPPKSAWTWSALFRHLTNPIPWFLTYLVFAPVLLVSEPEAFFSCIAMWINAFTMAGSRARVLFCEALEADMVGEESGVLMEDEREEEEREDVGVKRRGWKSRLKWLTPGGGRTDGLTVREEKMQASRWYVGLSRVIGVLGISGQGLALYLTYTQGKDVEAWRKKAAIGLLCVAAVFLLIEWTAEWWYGEKYWDPLEGPLAEKRQGKGRG